MNQTRKGAHAFEADFRSYEEGDSSTALQAGSTGKEPSDIIGLSPVP